MKTIDGNRTVYDLIQEYPELKPILVKIGFKPLTNDKMLNTVGRMMPLNNGAKQIKLSLDDLKEALQKEGFDLQV
ncbi:MAG TPA: DUF1858 domain-containing protein [Candidatus Atopostipes pullistercoris]|uniref:DUF1858 domain-containing protein n=1 Tax=Candidatus Atopostipes pullistercoris TaxID=2838467 RepID=A0A9D2JWN3_9LACT|nr:DUF1858 domain-containing protein [Candidatus Atopostipes pullistercoris]